MAEKSQDFFEDTDGIDMDIKIILALGIQEYACLAYRSPQFQLPAHENKQLIILEDSERKEKRREYLQFFREFIYHPQKKVGGNMDVAVHAGEVTDGNGNKPLTEKS